MMRPTAFTTVSRAHWIRQKKLLLNPVATRNASRCDVAMILQQRRARGGGLPTCTVRSMGSAADGKMRKPRLDPTAKRPNKLCDPYGQGGKPLGMNEVDRLRATIGSDWEVVVADGDGIPLALSREFVHRDFITGAHFVRRIAAVAEMNAHYPSITLDRKIARKGSWQVTTTVRCHTLVLGGLSGHDFHLAMLIDVEVERPDVKALFLPRQEGEG